MFGEGNIDLPVYSDKLDFKLKKQEGFNWEELNKQGIVRETIQVDGDNVILTKDFISYDGTFTKEETITLSVERFEEYKLRNITKEEAAREMTRLVVEIEKSNKAEDYERSGRIRDKIKILEKIVAI